VRVIVDAESEAKEPGTSAGFFRQTGAMGIAPHIPVGKAWAQLSVRRLGSGLAFGASTFRHWRVIRGESTRI
jgi:hypothetical protein